MNLPFRTPFFLPWLYPSLLWRVNTTTKELYLTFDDGPVTGPTEFVLDTLKAFHIKATFFCIGENIAKNYTLYTRIKEENHLVGNHTYNHLKGWSYPADIYLENINKCAQLLDTNLLFRPPYGRITNAQINSLQKHKIVMWDVLTQDYDRNLSKEKCLDGSIKATRNGSIIVFHDSYKAEKNLKYVLPHFIEHFLNKGYQFNTIPKV
jgi:peptidoglycan/xylan/chitin deacetylase (PgdA/CDA1 family)